MTTDWQAFHWHYHGDRDRLLTDGIRPLVRELWLDRSIDRFFFVRYGLGGPHVRLRVRAADDAQRERLAERVQAAASAFFERHPSTDSRSEEEIRKESESLVANDPNESMIDPLPDNSCHAVDFVPEVARYGGPRRLAASFDLFTVSSVLALDELVRTEGAAWGRRLPGAFRLLGALAVGLSTTQDRWLHHVDYVDRWWGESPLAAVFPKADAVYERSAATFGELWRSVLDPTIARPDPAAAAILAGRCLAEAIGDAPDRDIQRIVEGQLHMTANRLGLTNINEAYLGRLLARSASSVELDEWPAVAADDPDWLRATIDAWWSPASADDP